MRYILKVDKGRKQMLKVVGNKIYLETVMLLVFSCLLFYCYLYNLNHELTEGLTTIYKEMSYIYIYCLDNIIYYVGDTIIFTSIIIFFSRIPTLIIFRFIKFTIVTLYKYYRHKKNGYTGLEFELIRLKLRLIVITTLFFMTIFTPFIDSFIHLSSNNEYWSTIMGERTNPFSTTGIVPRAIIDLFGVRDWRNSGVFLTCSISNSNIMQELAIGRERGFVGYIDKEYHEGIRRSYTSSHHMEETYRLVVDEATFNRLNRKYDLRIDNKPCVLRAHSLDIPIESDKTLSYEPRRRT